MESQIRVSLSIVRKVFRAMMLFLFFAIAIPLVIGSIYGIPMGSTLSLIASVAILQAAAPPVGVALGYSPHVIVLIMASFAVGIVVTIIELCHSLAISSERVKNRVEKVENKMEKYPSIKKFGSISCIAIAWIPGIGLYGTPIIAWILGWNRLPAIIFTTIGFVIATIFVLLFASWLSIRQIAMIVAVAVLILVVVLAIRKYVVKRKRD